MTAATSLKTPCAQCPWRRSNQGKPHFGSFYTRANLRRLWNQIRNGGLQQSCHLTDASHPDHVAAGARESTTTQECPGSVVLVTRELQLVVKLGGTDRIEHDGIVKYGRVRKRGITKRGFQYWVVQRIAFAGKPFVGAPAIPDVPDPGDEVGIPDDVGPVPA